MKYRQSWRHTQNVTSHTPSIVNVNISCGFQSAKFKGQALIARIFIDRSGKLFSSWKAKTKLLIF